MSMTRAEAARLLQDARDPKLRKVLSRASGGHRGPFPGEIDAFMREEHEKATLRRLKLVLTGQVAGGKNNNGITRTGKRYPKAKWAKWRDFMVAQIIGQLPKDWKPITEPVNMEFHYYAGDKRRRDQPAILDACLHCLERAGVCADDTFLWVSVSSRSYDKENPRTEITIHLT